MSAQRTLRLGPDAPYRRVVGVGGLGSGIFLALEGNRTLGREESRGARLLEGRDSCKLHIVAHHVSVLLGADPSGRPFHVIPIGAVGADEAGRRLCAEMTQAGMDTSHVMEVEGRPTLFSVCYQYPDGTGGNLTTVDSAAAELDPNDVEALAPVIAEAGPETIVLALPEVRLATRRRLLEIGTEVGAFRVASFLTAEIEEARGSGLLGMVDLVSMNRDEATALVGGAFDARDPRPSLERAARVVGGDRDVRIVLTAGAAGAFGFEAGRWRHRPALAVGVANTAGAGDALLGGVVAALAAGVPLLGGPSAAEAGPAADHGLADGLDLGVVLAGLAVTSPHTIHPSADLVSLLAFAATHGLTPGPPLARAVSGA